MSHTENTVDHHHQRSGRISSSKRKLDEGLQFFVRMTPRGNTIVIHANPDDSVESVHEQISRITGIPIFVQRLIHGGKQLQWDHSLTDCSIEKDAGLELVCRMRSTQYPKTWRIVDDLVSSVFRLCAVENRNPDCSKTVKSRVKEFLGMFWKDDEDKSLGHVEIFKSACAPAALVMLFHSNVEGNRDCGGDAIRLFVYPNMYCFPPTVQHLCAPIVLDFCKLLGKTSQDDPLYVSCRNCLGTMLESIGRVHGSRYFDKGKGKASSVIQEIIPFMSELEGRLSVNLESETFCCAETSLSEVRNFGAFLHPLRLAIVDLVGGDKCLPIDLKDERPCCVLEIGTLHAIFLNLLGKIDDCLKKVEDVLVSTGEGLIEERKLGWSQYLAILKQLDSISSLYQGATEKILPVMKSRRVPLNAIVKYAKRSDEHTWLLRHIDVA